VIGFGGKSHEFRGVGASIFGGSGGGKLRRGDQRQRCDHYAQKGSSFFSVFHCEWRA